MKVLHIINSLGVGGAEKLVVLLIPALRKAGVDADLLIVDRHQTIFHEQLEARGVDNIQSLKMERFYNPFAILKLAYILRKHRRHYDVIHTHLFPTQYWVAIAAFLARVKTPLMTTEQNTTNRRRSIKFFQFLDKYIYRRYSVITTVSPLATEFLSNYVNKNVIRYITIPNAVDVESLSNAQEINIASELGVSIDTTFAIQVSSFSPQKDHETLITAMSKVKTDSLHLLLVGDGNRRNSMKQLAESLGVDDRVHFLGIRNDIPSLLKSSDIAVLSSHYEGLSLSLLEAFASGTPFVGSDVPGLGEITQRGGLTVPHKNSDALAAVLDNLSDSCSLKQSTAENGRAVAEQYSIQKISAQYIKEYELLLAK